MKLTPQSFAFTLLLACHAFAQNQDLNLQISPDRPAGTYAAGETITWNLSLSGLKPGTEPPAPAYAITSGDSQLTSGTVTFAKGKASVSVKLDKPGVAVLKVDLKSKWGSPASGAAVDWEKISSTGAEPADFDTFWKSKLGELATVPINPVLEEIADSGSPGVQLWKITMDGFQGSKIYGYIARPKGTQNLPAQLQLQYWGLYPLNKAEVVGHAQKGWLALNIMAHDLPCDRDTSFYKNPGINTYVNTGAEDPEKSYFLRMFLSCSRAVDYLASREDWNGKTLLVQGGSQGGFQTLAAAALNRKVTVATVFVPGGGNLTGFLENQPNGWPGWVYSKSTGAQREAMIRTAGYYDTNNFAKRINCPVLVGTGLTDTISRPETQFTMFHNLAGPKRMVVLPSDDHTAPHTAYKAVQAEWWKAAALGQPVPLR